MNQKILFSENLDNDVMTAISACRHDRLFIIADVNTNKHCLPLLEDIPAIKNAIRVVLPPSDTYKDINSVCNIWNKLQKSGATRQSLIINLGGGMITDLGGFAASTFKRGVDFVNIPTTLLAMVDASVGGKTGINFGGVKNEIGVFNDSRFVIINTGFLKTLSRENILSGYAEMLKHGLLSNENMWAELMNYDLRNHDFKALQNMLVKSLEVKKNIIKIDPYERKERKALNLGHTFGHAFESFALKRHPVLHGYAVAYGLTCELYLSTIREGFPADKMRQTIRFIRENYGKLDFSCKNYDEIIQTMMHDKKNSFGRINFTLLGDIGDIRVNRNATDKEIKEVLDFYRDGQ